MQVIIHAMATKGTKSLRSVITNDLENDNDQWIVVSKKNSKRKNGWATLKLREPSPGSLKLEWDPKTMSLIARAITKKKNKPDLLIGSFIYYLLKCYGKRISSINIRGI